MPLKEKILLNRNLHIIFSVTLIAVMGVTTIAPAFPSISQSLGVSSNETIKLIIYFTLPGIFLSPVMGIMADRLGRKRILAPSLFLFACAGTACAFSQNFQLLLFFRFLQGIGAAAISSLNQTIIGDIYAGKDRLAAMGYNATVLSFGTLVYPALGGAIALLGWNYPFLLSLLALPVGLLVLFVLESPEPQSEELINSYFKSALKNMKSLHLLGLLTASVSTFILLYGTVLSYFPFFLERNFHSSSLTIGLLISCASIGTALGSSNLRRINKYLPRKHMILTAFFLYALALVTTVYIRSYALMFLPILLYGFANGMNIPVVQTMISEYAPMEYRGAFMSFNSTVLRFGQTTGPLIFGLCFSLWSLQGVFFGAIFLIALTARLLTLLIKKD